MQPKCAQYWPNEEIEDKNQGTTFGHINVYCRGEEIVDAEDLDYPNLRITDVIRRELDIEDTKASDDKNGANSKIMVAINDQYKSQISFNIVKTHTFLNHFEISERHSFTHFQYVGWPDHSAPLTSDSILVMVKALRKLVSSNSPNQVKLLVHCSAGVGRTGTFIALYQLMELLDKKVTEYKRLNSQPSFNVEEAEEINVDIFNTVFSLRRQRCLMV